MKKILLSILAVAAMVSCNSSGENEFVINGEAPGITDGTNVYLQKQDSIGALVHLDTVKVEKGKFKFEGEVTDPSLHFIEIQSNPGKAVLVLEDGTIDMKINKDTIMKSKVSGTYSNDQLMAYSNEYEKVQKKVQEFQMANMERMNQAQATNDTVVRNALMKEYKMYQEEFMKLTLDHVEKQPKSYLSLLFMGQLINQPDRDLDKLNGYYNNLDPKLKNSKEGKKLKKTLDEAVASDKKKTVVPQQ